MRQQIFKIYFPFRSVEKILRVLTDKLFHLLLPELCIMLYALSVSSAPAGPSRQPSLTTDYWRQPQLTVYSTLAECYICYFTTATVFIILNPTHPSSATHPLFHLLPPLPPLSPYILRIKSLIVLLALHNQPAC